MLIRKDGSNTEQGFQVELSEKSHDIKVKEDAFVINIGDRMINLRNGTFKGLKTSRNW